MIPLPIDAHLDQIVRDVRRARAAVVTAAPAAGKTTRVPPALTEDGRVILLQPRRVAARAIAARIAAERGWTLGREVGWQIRFEKRFTADTRLLVVTEGILTARLQTDPLLSDFTTIVLDEFHERSVHADLAIALARQAWRARQDLRIVVMSATLDAGPVSSFLDGCPVIDVPGRLHPIDIRYAPGQSIADAAADVLRETSGGVLCFLPGAGEIRRAMTGLESRIRDVQIVPLHGSLDADAQDLALHPAAGRRIIVATNIAETSLTVPGVTAVIDSGLHKVARYDADRGIDSLETERITVDAADQRAGRAGRTAPGVVRRLWDARDRLRPHREPEIHRVDLSGPALDVIAWGGDPRTFEWFDRPRDERIEAALVLLTRLELIAGGSRLTPLGEQVRHLPLHPRLARILVASGGARDPSTRSGSSRAASRDDVARACAILSERHLLPPRTASTASDLLSAIDDWRNVPPHVRRVADQLIANPPQSAPRRARGAPSSSKGAIRDPQYDEPAFRRALLAGYPDRVAQRRQPGSPNVLLAAGTGAVMSRESGVRDGEFLVALDVSRAAMTNPQSNPQSAFRDPQYALVRVASVVDRDWLTPTSAEIIHRFDEASGRVRAVEIDRYDALVLAERPVTADPEIAARLLTAGWLQRGPRDEDQQLLRRLRFTGAAIDVEALVSTAAYGVKSLDEIRIARALAPDTIRDLDRDAPETLGVPSGRHTRLEYRDDGSVSASVKLQELFGLAETPRVGRQREAVVLSLLAPNGRPVQVTRDLRSFWDRTYPEVRKELRGRYPRHPWPEDPWAATPSARPTRRK